MAEERDQTDNLEKALLERANRLAREYLARAEQQREDIHRDLREKLHLSEERELLSAREKSERVYQQRIQASELQLQARLDDLRWQQVQQLLDELLHQLQQRAEDEETYLQLFGQLLQDAAGAIDAEHLIVQVNPNDRQRLQNVATKQWQTWLPDKEITLSDQTCDCSGGVLVYDSDNRIRVNNTFEGRIAMLHEQLEQTIMEHLFSKTLTTGEMIHG
ncbi:MAG: V-type ATP synthase subunit E [Thiohalophilus sp.]|uniref:V-type ATP synthase subunit E n=1 Tax=Thiohalophilus sp. TaxID=3028392 RepID=UPI00286FFBC4|nr:V-type ATP synthase subunit E [Thiohalophilus sp.]MDR9435784.1 V-type ATP synthase subunit E [Thiohalophilus sp.]